MPEILGLHHVTAIAGDSQKNIDFYAGVLGLRLVKLTVNYDDPTTYHLYYGDGQGHPGTITTFSPWTGAIPNRTGTEQLTITSLPYPKDPLVIGKGALQSATRRFMKPGQILTRSCFATGVWPDSRNYSETAPDGSPLCGFDRRISE
jgi:catechol 2,3-dioxygenase-like lactoylglutathione lyase family enzyme